ncbi:MAG: Ku protein [Flavipsychrobacter sp.]|nr:Ku protein [Flavipsychrobacter sp.]
MRAIWSGAIGFGLVNIPVRIFSAVQSSALDLDMLDKHDNARIRYQRVNEETGEEVAWGDIVKGYKVEDKYVVLTEDDFAKASPEKSKTIEIQEFAEEVEIDTTFYEMPYYLEPAKGGERAYALLREALKDSGKVAIGTFVMRTKENLCLLKPQGNMLLLLRLRFHEEIRDYEDLNIPTARTAVKPAELKMAKALIAQLTPKSFDISRYKDTYDAALLKMIKLRAKGKDLPEPKLKMVRNKSKDIMEQLKESLGATKAKKAPAKKAVTKKIPVTRRKKAS